MKDDASVLLTYRTFEKDKLPLLKAVEDQKSKILKKKNFLNKARCYQAIIALYEKYLMSVRESWKTIYASDEEFINTAKQIEPLLQGKSIYAETNIQWTAEQFFLWLSMSLSHVIMMYSGKEKESVATDECNNARCHMHDMMDKMNEEESEVQ